MSCLGRVFFFLRASWPNPLEQLYLSCLNGREREGQVRERKGEEGENRRERKRIGTRMERNMRESNEDACIHRTWELFLPVSYMEAFLTGPFFTQGNRRADDFDQTIESK